jgi:hypothetical protein
MPGNVSRILEEVTRQNTLRMLQKSIYQRDITRLKAVCSKTDIRKAKNAGDGTPAPVYE